MIGGFYEDIYNEWYYGCFQTPTFPIRPRGITPITSGTTTTIMTIILVLDVEYPLPETNCRLFRTVAEPPPSSWHFSVKFPMTLTDKWSVTGGARWFEFDRRLFYTRFQFPEGIPAWNPELGMFDWELDGTGSPNPRAVTRCLNSAPRTTSATTRWFMPCSARASGRAG